MAVPGSPNIMGPSFSDDDAKVFKPAPHTSREPLLDKEQAPCAPCLSLSPPRAAGRDRIGACVHRLLTDVFVAGFMPQYDVTR